MWLRIFTKCLESLDQEVGGTREIGDRIGYKRKGNVLEFYIIVQFSKYLGHILNRSALHNPVMR